MTLRLSRTDSSMALISSALPARSSSFAVASLARASFFCQSSLIADSIPVFANAWFSIFWLIIIRYSSFSLIVWRATPVRSSISRRRVDKASFFSVYVASSNFFAVIPLWASSHRSLPVFCASFNPCISRSPAPCSAASPWSSASYLLS